MYRKKKKKRKKRNEMNKLVLKNRPFNHLFIVMIITIYNTFGWCMI